jgi:hypothetical protein
VSKDFDTTLVDALDLAAGAAQTAGAAAARTRGRQRSVRRRNALVAMSLILVAAGTAVTIRASSSSNGGTSQTTDTSTPGATGNPSTGATGNPSAAANSYSGALESLLLPTPSGAAPLTPRQGVSGGGINVDQYVANDYPGDQSLQAGATKQILSTFGFESAAVRWYRDAQGDDVEFYLIRFTGPDGAMGYGLSLASTRLQNGEVTEFPDSTAAGGYGFTIPASDNYTEADLFGYSGNIFMSVHVFARGDNAAPTVTSVFASQYSAVRAAEH